MKLSPHAIICSLPQKAQGFADSKGRVGFPDAQPNPWPWLYTVSFASSSTAVGKPRREEWFWQEAELYLPLPLSSKSQHFLPFFVCSEASWRCERSLVLSFKQTLECSMPLRFTTVMANRTVVH